MNAQQAENLRILIRHMENDVTRTLFMGSIAYRGAGPLCGTPACAWGEACMVPALQPYLGTLDTRRGPDGLYECFGENMASLFSSSLNGKQDVSPQEWAAEARKVLTERGYSMDDATTKPDAFSAFMAKVQEPVAVTAE